MRRKSSRRARHSVSRHCTICSFPVLPSFAFDVSPLEDGSVWMHPDCFAYTHSDTVGIPSRPLDRGRRLRHTCGDATCVNPAHLEVMD